jgi:hypothetical protein
LKNENQAGSESIFTATSAQPIILIMHLSYKLPKIMKTLYNVTLLLSLIILIACEERSESIVIGSDELLGNWINPVVADTIWTFERAELLKNNDYGFSFKSAQLFVERKNAGWCGTPPISYADFDGSWTANGSVINITVGYWGGEAVYQWKIISIDNNHLTIYRLKEEYHNQE